MRIWRIFIMGLNNKNNKPISENDKKALINMLKGSLEEHIAIIEDAKENSDRPNFYNPIIEVYKKSINNLEIDIQNQINNKNDISVGDFIDNVFDKISEDAFEAMDKNSIEKDEFFDIVDKHFGNKRFLDLLSGEDTKKLAKDSDEGFEKSSSSFKFVTKPMPGIENIGEYNPATDSVKDLYKGRTGNSTTLSANVDELKNKLENLPDDEAHQEEREKIQDKIDGFINGTFGLNTGAEIARIHSADLMNKDEVSFGDLFNAISEINEAARPGDPAGGKLRGFFVRAGNIEGISASYCPKQMYNILHKVADGINEIKKVEDKDLQKTMAVQLAAYAYPMTLSAHAFGDGNGRTCRLFCDTILQTFGLPPNTPVKEQTKITQTMGAEMNFALGADAFYKSVQISDATLKKDPEVRKQERITRMPEKKIDDAKTSTKLSALYEVDAETIKHLKDLQKKAKKVSGTFKDSKEYKDFRTSIDKSLKIAEQIMANESNPGFNMKKAEAAYAAAIRGMRKSANAYKEYKLKDKTIDKNAEPQKKKINKDDKKKLDLIDSVTNDKKLITVKKPKGGMVK